MNSFGMRPGIILLREGTDTSQGKPQLISNINACQATADMIRTTLGPSGRDKLVATGRGVTISNDGATIMKLLEIEHPAAKTLVDISISQDYEVGDGTTSVVLLASEILQQMKTFIEDNVHPQIISSYIKRSCQLAIQYIQSSLSISFTQSELREMLLKTASTALNSKLISNHKDLFAPMVVDAVLSLQDSNAKDNDDIDVDENFNNQNHLSMIDDMILIKQIPGGDVRQSMLINGVAFKKTFSYAGFEQMNKKYINPKILLLNVELELKSEKENAEVRITDPSQYQTIVNAEWNVIYSKLDACVNCGAHIVLSRLPIGDLATQYFADRNMFCAGRVHDIDLKRVAKATNAAIQTSTSSLHINSENILGTCGLFEERQIGEERYNLFTECPMKHVTTIVLRGGTEQFIAESERSVHDALMVVKRSLISKSIVPGGGAVEMTVSQYLRQYAYTISGKGQLIVLAYAKALEVIPRQLCDNAGYDSTDILSALRKKHNERIENSTDEDDKPQHYGVDVINGSICNTYKLGIWEPSDNKINSIQAATEAACVILSIDETVIAPSSQDPGGMEHSSGMIGGGGGGRPMSNMMNNAMEATQSGARSGQLAPGVSYMKGRGG